MPLDKSGTKEAFGKNVSTEEAAGKSQKQAVAIAYSVANDAATAAGVVFHDNGRVLMLQRPDGTWGFPAGTIEEGETPEAAARRETMEETGYVAQCELQSIGIFDGFFHAYFADVEQFAVVLNEEHTGAAWFALSELPAPLHGCAPNVLAAICVAMTGDKADTAKSYDINGWFEVFDNPLSRVGVYNYLGKNIPQEVAKGNAGVMFSVYRPAEELSDPACLNSFRLIPWVIDHSMLGNGTNGTKQVEEKIARGVLGERIYFDADDGDGVMKGNIKCWSEILAGQIHAGKTPLSLGYRCVYEYKPGVFNGKPYTYVQRRIRGNHFASVDDGRMGPEVAVMDGFSTTETEYRTMKETKLGKFRKALVAFCGDAEEKIEKSEDSSGDLKKAVQAIKDALPLLEALEQLKAVGTSDELGEVADKEDSTGDERSTANNGLTAPTGDEAPPEKDKEPEGKGMDAKEIAALVNKAVQTALAGHGMDSQEVVRTIAQRDKLAAQLSEFVGTFDHSEMTAQQVAEYGVKKLEIPAVAKGSEVAAVTAYMHKRQSPRKLPVAHAGDSTDRNAKPSFVQAQVTERS